MAYKVWADGGVHGNGREDSIGAYGTVVEIDGVRHTFSKAYTGVTNNQMELMGALAGLQFLATQGIKSSAIIVTSDSKYLVRGMSEWVNGWAKRGWKRSEGPLANVDLWKQLKAFNDKHMITWVWVKGHQGHPENEQCDQLAAEAIQEFKNKEITGELDT